VGPAYARVLDALRARPDVAAAGMASLIPFGEINESVAVQRAGAPLQRGDSGLVDAVYTMTGASYFDALGLRILEGREFTRIEERTNSGERLAIIDQPLASHLFGTADPIGQHVQYAVTAQPPAVMRVVGVVPATENMPGGRAIKPGDILKSAAGKTVEVINTDAEGRLILGDGLWYARQLGATHLVDVATLTGAVVVALGRTTSGLFGAPEEWVERVRKVAERAGDRAWPLPLYDDYRDQLKSEIADMMNTGGRPAGSITAAMFLKEFTDNLPWAHLDIAGTAWVDDAKPFLPKGPSGVAVRTLAELAFEKF